MTKKATDFQQNHTNTTNYLLRKLKISELKSENRKIEIFRKAFAPNNLNNETQRQQFR